MNDDLTAVLAEVQQWQAETFGDRSPIPARCGKLAGEVHELREAAEIALDGPLTHGDARDDVALEAADVAFVLVDVLRAFGMSPGDLADAVRRKLIINRRRTWAQNAATGEFSGSKP